MNTEKLKQLAIDALEDLKATDITVIKITELTSIADYMIIASARSSRQLHAIADHLVQQAKKACEQPRGVEGKTSTNWVLVDLGDVIVHMMMPDTREFYALEKLWMPINAN